MNLKNIDLNLLMVFQTIFEERNLTKAGERLHLSQPAVSHALKRLRDRVQDPLFIRTSEGMVPTAFAESIQATVADALGQLQTCLSPAQAFDPAHQAHQFRIMMSDYNATIVLPKLMALLEAEAPLISIINIPIDRQQAYEALSQGRADVVISSEIQGPNLLEAHLFEDRYVTLASKHNSSLKNGLNLEQFVQLRHVLYSLEGIGTGFVDIALKKLNLKRTVSLRTPYVSIIPSIIENSNYIVTLPSKVAHKFIHSYQVQLYPTPVELKVQNACIYWHQRTHQDPAAQWLRSTLKKLFIDQ